MCSCQVGAVSACGWGVFPPCQVDLLVHPAARVALPPNIVFATHLCDRLADASPRPAASGFQVHPQPLPPPAGPNVSGCRHEADDQGELTLQKLMLMLPPPLLDNDAAPTAAAPVSTRRW